MASPKTTLNDSNPDEMTREEIEQQTVPSLPGDTPPEVKQIGRYRLERLLGEGGFGRVYLAHDEDLDRNVAVKIPHLRLVTCPDDAVVYLTEARTVANLDHPNIVPVHDVGSTAEVPCYVVSKYVDGIDLATKLRSSRYTDLEAARLVATMADALHYAHKKGLVHRDVKPGNILIGADGKPYLVDFGLALREESIGKGPRHAGTPAYMSPEQARGEGHRVDGRSDVFSLGVVLYQLLSGRRPFGGTTEADILRQVIKYDARPLRQYDERLPKEIERICNRALAKRTSERYSSAHDFAEDLRHFIDQQSVAQTRDLATASGELETSGSLDLNSLPANQGSADSATRRSSTSESNVVSTAIPVTIVPKGLRSFDAHDSDFFLELVPGPRDRMGLPDQLRFWKTKIEETDADLTFPVGLIYGQSGCGKSSMIKAGLLPRLSEDVMVVYVEATPEETESRILRGLRKVCPGLEHNLNLRESLRALRSGVGISIHKKVLIVVDQFEQWLHLEKGEDAELIEALRQCDGGRVQCIVMVRDDFWMAATQFMRGLDLRLLEGENSAAVELFPLRHATKVLIAFGQAFGTLPDDVGKISAEQKEFLNSAAVGLADEGKVICVRLALFAEMMKGKTWNPEALKSVGGTKGVGATFLEETFSAATAPPEHQYHQKAARRVLQALLPDSGTNIKGEMKSHQELLEVSGYSRRPRDFDDLIRILDREVRLVTPTDPEGRGGEDDSVRGETAQQYFQLTHDYLVHSLRDWLTRKQKETRRGRAELLLQERASVWSIGRETRYLPSLIEMLNIWVHTSRRSWNAVQSRMMRAAARFHGLRTTALLGVLALAALGLWKLEATVDERNTRTRVEAALDSLQNSRGDVVPFALADIAELPTSSVQDAIRQRRPTSTGQRLLALSYAQSSLGNVDHDLLISQIGTVRESECRNLAAALDADHTRSLELLSEAEEIAESQEDWELMARLAIVALAMGEDRHAVSMLSTTADSNPIERAAFIDVFSQWHAKIEEIADLVRLQEDSLFVSGMVLAIGNIPVDLLRSGEQDVWQPLLNKLYLEDPDSGVHGAAGWTLRNWDTELPSIRAGGPIDENRRWSVTESGLTMVKLLKGELIRPPTDGQIETIPIEHDFLISDREISVDLFSRFYEDPIYAGEKPTDWDGANSEVSPTGLHPVQQISWLDAIMFCNWLSHQEGFKPYYVLHPDSGWQTDESSDGYRLPSDEEWEYACRAGTTSDYSCGDARYLNQYAQFRREDQAAPCGTKMCNAWGLFDMHGNVWEWIGAFPNELKSTVPQPAPRSKTLRGGSRGGTSFQIRTDARSWQLATHRSLALGLRVVRQPND